MMIVAAQTNTEAAFRKGVDVVASDHEPDRRVRMNDGTRAELSMVDSR
jgi:hypothetical protein